MIQKQLIFRNIIKLNFNKKLSYNKKAIFFIFDHKVNKFIEVFL